MGAGPARRSDDGPRRRPRTGEVADRLRHLAASGDLVGLPGEGAPLPPDPDADAGAAWAARHLMRTANAVPLWVDLRREIEERSERIARGARAHDAWLSDREALLRTMPADRVVETRRATRVRDERVRGELAAAVDELNALIRRYDLHVIPPLQLPLATLDRLRR